MTASTNESVTQPSGGNNGTAGTNQFAIPSTVSNTTLATNINVAMGTPGGTTKGFTSPTITLTALAAGSTGFAAALDGTPTGITITTTTAGTDGVTSGTATPPTFAYWSGAAALSAGGATSVAANIASAINANPTVGTSASAGVTATAGISGSSGTVKIVANTAGSTGGTIVDGVGSFTGLTWAPLGALGGTNLDGTPSGTAFNYWSGNAAVSASVLAGNIATAMLANSTLTGAFTITSNTTATPATITLTDKTTGTTGNSYTASSSFTGYAWGDGGDFSGGAANATVGAGQYPAKFSFYPIGTPACDSAGSPDYVVYNTSELGTATQASVVAYDNLYTGTCTGTTPLVYWAYNTGGTAVTSPVLTFGGAQVAFVQNSNVGGATLVLLKWARSAVGRTLTGGVTSGSVNFTVSSGTLVATDVGAQISGTGIPAGDTIASYISSTSGTLATAATATGSGEPLTVYAETYATPGVPPTVAAGSFSTCTAPCMTLLPFYQTTVGPDSNSSPFVDYATGTLYVGDDNGYLHQFTNIFTASGTPTETVGGGWPSEVNVVGANLNSPVYDSGAYLTTTVTPQVFVTDSGGFVYGVNASSGVVSQKSSKLTGNSSTVGIVDAPLVDSWADTVYAYVGDDGNTLSGSNCDNTTGCEGVFRFSIKTGATGTAQGFSTSPNANVCTPANGTSWATGGTNGNACGAESVFGVGTATTALYDGSFDNTYYGSDTTQGGTPAGNLWSCVQIAATGAKLSRTAISNTTYGFSNNALSTATNVIGGSAPQALTNAAASCSPLTEIYNTATSTDWIFFSVTAGGVQTGCTGACLYNYNVTTSPASTTAGIATTGGSSGIVIDNAANTTTYPGASQIYYSPLGSQTCGTGGAGGCAVQAAQSAP